MLEAINRFFRSQIAPEPARPDAERRLQVATCALLLEAAHADDEFSPREQQTIEQLMRRQFQLTPAEFSQLVSLAEQERRDSTDLFQFTRLMAAEFSRLQKLVVLEQLWRVVYSDGRLEAREDALMHKLCTLLGLKHKELIALKLRVKEGDQG